jgi:hypothetical protein
MEEEGGRVRGRGGGKPTRLVRPTWAAEGERICARDHRATPRVRTFLGE